MTSWERSVDHPLAGVPTLVSRFLTRIYLSVQAVDGPKRRNEAGASALSSLLATAGQCGAELSFLSAVAVGREERAPWKARGGGCSCRRGYRVPYVRARQMRWLLTGPFLAVAGVTERVEEIQVGPDVRPLCGWNK